MEKQIKGITILATCVGVVCAIAISCLRSSQAEPPTDAPRVAPATYYPFVAADLSRLPDTWYCLSPWSTDPKAENQGMLVFAWRLFISLNWPGKFDKTNDKTPEWAADVTIGGLNQERHYPRWASWPSPQTMRDALASCNEDKARPPPDWGDGAESLRPQVPNSFTHESEHQHPCVYDQQGGLVEYQARVSPKGWAGEIYKYLCKDPPSKGPTGGGGASSPGKGDISLFRYGQCEGQEGTNQNSYSFQALLENEWVPHEAKMAPIAI